MWGHPSTALKYVTFQSFLQKIVATRSAENSSMPYSAEKIVEAARNWVEEGETSFRGGVAIGNAEWINRAKEAEMSEEDAQKFWDHHHEDKTTEAATERFGNGLQCKFLESMFEQVGNIQALMEAAGIQEEITLN